MPAKIDLNGQLAELYRLSPNNSRISKHITQAKTALGITAPKRLSEPEKVAVYQYHVNINSQDAIANVETFSQANRLESVEIISHTGQLESVKINSQTDYDDAVNSVSQDAHNDSVELFSQATDSESVEIISRAENVEIISRAESVNSVSHDKHSEPVETISQTESIKLVEHISHNTHNDSVELFSQTRIAFYVEKNAGRTRQVIALDGYYLNALAVLGVGKPDVPKWVQAAVDHWPAFNPELPITKQVKYLIIRELSHDFKLYSEEPRL